MYIYTYIYCIYAYYIRIHIYIYIYIYIYTYLFIFSVNDKVVSTASKRIFGCAKPSGTSYLASYSPDVVY